MLAIKLEGESNRPYANIRTQCDEISLLVHADGSAQTVLYYAALYEVGNLEKGKLDQETSTKEFNRMLLEIWKRNALVFWNNVKMEYSGGTGLL
jgi:hypothetical protein